MKTQKMIGIFILTAGLFLFTICNCQIAIAADWPNWRGPSHNGISNETSWSPSLSGTAWPKGGPKILWKASLGFGFCTISVSNGRAYTMGNVKNNDILYCFDAQTGDKVWSKSYPCPLLNDNNNEGGPCATPTVDGGMVYTFSRNGDVFCFKADSGDIVWHRNISSELGIRHPTWHFASSPRIIGNLIILNAGTAGLALNKADGKEVWQNGNGQAGYSTVVAFNSGGRECVAILAAQELAGVVVSTGEVIWRYPWETDFDINAADPIISGDTIFVTSGYNKGCAVLRIQPDRVTEIWSNRNMRAQCSSCVLWEGYIYGFDGQFNGNGYLTCLDYRTGEAKWSHRGLGTGSLMLAGDTSSEGRLIVLGERGRLVIARAWPEKYQELASAQILTGRCWTMPVLANGRIYARNAAGDLVCVDVSN